MGWGEGVRDEGETKISVCVWGGVGVGGRVERRISK